MNKNYLKILLVSTTFLSLSQASDINTKYDLKYIIEREGNFVAVSGKDIGDKRINLISYTCVDKGGVKQKNMINGVYHNNQIEEFKCIPNNRGDVNCHLRLTWFVDVYEEAKKRYNKDRCESIAPQSVTKDYNFLLKNNTSEILNLGDHLTIDYKLNVTE